MEVDLNKAALYAVGDDNKSKVINKALEILRKMDMKMPLNKKNTITYRNILAVDIGCRILELPYDNNKLMSLLTISKKAYQDSFTYCKNLLDLKWNIPAALELLSLHFDQQLKNPALKIYDEYKEKYVNKQLKSIQDEINSSSSAYHAAAFYIAARNMNIKLDKAKIIKIADVDSSLFKNCVDSISNVCDNKNSSMQKSLKNDGNNMNNNKNQILQNSNINNNNYNRKLYDNKHTKSLVTMQVLQNNGDNRENIQPLNNNNKNNDNNNIRPILSNLKFEKADKSEIINKQIRALGIVPSVELEQKKKIAEDEEDARAKEIERNHKQYLAFKRETLAKRRKLESESFINT